MQWQNLLNFRDLLFLDLEKCSRDSCAFKLETLPTLAKFFVQTDHQTLRYFLTQTKLSKKHMRWTNFLSMFHFQIVHVKGKKNIVADALSRKPQISAVSIPYHHELDDMKEQYCKVQRKNERDKLRICVPCTSSKALRY